MVSCCTVLPLLLYSTGEPGPRNHTWPPVDIFNSYIDIQIMTCATPGGLSIQLYTAWGKFAPYPYWAHMLNAIDQNISIREPCTLVAEILTYTYKIQSLRGPPSQTIHFVFLIHYACLIHNPFKFILFLLDICLPFELFSTTNSCWREVRGKKAEYTAEEKKRYTPHYSHRESLISELFAYSLDLNLNPFDQNSG